MPKSVQMHPKAHKIAVHSKLRELGERVRTARREANLSQEELAALAGMSRRPIYNLESGKGAVGLDSLLQVLDCLGMELTIQPKAAAP